MPLEYTDQIDIILKPDQEGKVGLVITDAGVTMDPTRRAALFREKVRAYFGAVVDGLFRKDHPRRKTSDYFIQLVSTNPPTPEMYELHSIQSRSRPEHHMEVRFVQFDGRPWPGRKIPVAPEPSRIPPPSAKLRAFAEAELAFAFETIRDNCFHPLAAWLDRGQKKIACLALPGEQIILCAQDMAAKSARSVTHFVCVYDAYIGSGNEQHDALMARCSERGRERGLLLAQKYLPRHGRKKPALVGGPEVIGECENDLEPGTQ